MQDKIIRHIKIYSWRYYGYIVVLWGNLGWMIDFKNLEKLLLWRDIGITLTCIFILLLIIKRTFLSKYFYQLILSTHLIAITLICYLHVYKPYQISLIEAAEAENEKVNEKVNEKDFNLTETGNVDKIIMSDKGGNIITLEKEEDKWIINSKYPVWERQIKYTLGVMKDIRIKSSVSEQKTKFVLQNIATKGVKVEIFEKEQKIKSYYIGGNTPDHHGTYMIMEKAKNAYVMHIPERHPGILNPKYGIEGIYVNETVWREPITINISPEEISEVKVIDFINQEQSYTINIKNKTLADFGNNEILIDNRKYNEFASFFSNLHCGIYRSDLNPDDFILIKKIYITNNNQTDSLIIYDVSKIQKTQKEYSSTVENLYAKWNNSDMVIIQKNIFNKVLITLDEIKE